MITLKYNVTLVVSRETKQNKRNMMMSRRSDIDVMILVYDIIFDFQFPLDSKMGKNLNLSRRKY